MSTINAINPKIDQTVRIFDQFYNYEENVPAAEYDLILSYFKTVFNTVEQAQNFTVAIFRIAQESNVDPLSIMQSMQGLNGPQLTASLCYYLNSVRSPSTLLGVLQQSVPNFWASRNVRQ